MTEALSTGLVSIPLCTYNGARFLRQQLQSLLDQTYRHLEIVAVDDSSTDETVEILREYASRDPRIRVLIQPVNVGLRRNFEHAVQACRGEFVSPSDQDDVWLPDKVAALLDCIGAHSMSYCDSQLIAADGHELDVRMSDKWPMSDIYSPVSFVMGNCVSSHAMLFRRELLQSAVPIPDGFFHDWWLAAVATSVHGIAYCPQPLVLYRQHDNNVTDVLGRRKSASSISSVGIKKADKIQLRITALSTLPGGQQKYLSAWLALWERRNNQWFSPALAVHLFHSARDVFLFTRTTVAGRLLAPCKYLIGLRLKRALRSRKYAVNMGER